MTEAWCVKNRKSSNCYIVTIAIIFISPAPNTEESLLRFFWVSLKPDGRQWSQYWQLNNLKCLLIQKNESPSYVNEKKWRRCYSEKFTILLTIFELISWKFSLGAGAPFYVGLQKKKILFAAPRNPFCRKFYGLWCFLCKFYSEKIPIFRAIFAIFFGNWLLDARATFRL